MSDSNSIEEICTSTSTRISSNVTYNRKKRIWIGRIPPSVTEYQLLKLCEKYGKIDAFDFKISIEQQTSSSSSTVQPSNMAFVTFQNDVDANNAIKCLNNSKLNQHKVKCEWAKEKSEAPRKKSRQEFPNVLRLDSNSSRKRSAALEDIDKIERKLKKLKDTTVEFQCDAADKFVPKIPLLEMPKKGITNELLNVDNEIKSIDQQINALKQRKRQLVEKKQQLEKALEHSVKAAETEQLHVWESETFNWSSKLRKNLREIFQMEHYRDHQLSAMNANLSGEDVVLVMSTGGGKSLCYQLPSTINDGFTLVVSPLISLMEDQMIALKKFGVVGALLNQNCTQKETTEIQQAMRNAESRLKLVYVTPEKLAKSKRFMSNLGKCYEAGLLQRIAIDEVHCCSQWGHDFRPDYKFLNMLRRQFPNAPIMGLTATATSRVIDDVKNMLGIPGALTFRASFNRKNLFYEVLRKPNDGKSFVDELVRLIKTKFVDQSGIVYCFSKKETEEVCDGLRSNGIKSACYHADLSADVRTKVHEKWYDNRYQVIVATVAFGMGIDKANVRFVVHQTLPKSMENYYQESGRAGRDDLDASCVVYFRFADVFRQTSMVCTEKTGLENLLGMVKYCHSTTNVCRRKIIADHFGEIWSPNWCHCKCDVCNKTPEKKHNENLTPDLTNYAKILMNLLKDSQQKLTGLKLLDLFVKKSKLSRDQCEYFIIELLLENYLKFDFHFSPYAIITYVALGHKAHLLDQQDYCLKFHLPDDKNGAKAPRKKRKIETVQNDTVDEDLDVSQDREDDVIEID